jgi:hypothetical protein
MKKNKIVILGLLISLKGLAQITTLSLTTSKDAPIGYHDGANTANNNYGYAIQNAAFAIPSVAMSGGLNNNQALIDFNLSSIPVGSTIISAKLNLYGLGPFAPLPGHAGTNNASYLERITQNWLENTVTWNTRPSLTTTHQVILNQSINSTQNYLNINVTSLVQDMVNDPLNSFGFSLRLINEVSYNCLGFASKDNGNPSLIPTLVITYSTDNVSVKEEGEKTSNFTCFPNPAKSLINFSIKPLENGSGKISIYDTQGKAIKEINISINDNSINKIFEINLESMNSGIYYYSILFENEQKSGKFIIE